MSPRLGSSKLILDSRFRISSDGFCSEFACFVMDLLVGSMNEEGIGSADWSQVPLQ